MKRYRKKSNGLTAEEKKVLELYHATEHVTFSAYDRTKKEAFALVKKLGEPNFHERDQIKWFTCGNKKMTVTSFLKDAISHE